LASRGPKRPIPSYDELKELPVFKQKLHLFLGAEALGKVAKEARRRGLRGISRTTLNDLLYGGRVPNQTHYDALAALSGYPSGYWSEDSIPPERPDERSTHSVRIVFGGDGTFRVTSLAAAKGPDPQREVESGRDALDVTRIKPFGDQIEGVKIEGRSGWPFVDTGQIVLYAADKPGETGDGELVVADYRGELVVKRRKTVTLPSGTFRVYESINDDGYQDIYVDLSEEQPTEYPVVGNLIRF